MVITRTGGRTLTCESATALRRHFGFRSVRIRRGSHREWAATVAQRTADALLDLADVLGFADPELSGGVLSLRLGVYWCSNTSCALCGKIT